MQPAESGLDDPDPEPDLDNANVGKQSFGFCGTLRRRISFFSVFYLPADRGTTLCSHHTRRRQFTGCPAHLYCLLQGTHGQDVRSFLMRVFILLCALSVPSAAGYAYKRKRGGNGNNQWEAGRGCRHDDSDLPAAGGICAGKNRGGEKSRYHSRDVGKRELCQLLCAYRSEQHGRLDLLRPVLVAFGKELRVQTEFTASRSVRFDSRPDQCYYIYTPLGV